MFEFSIEDNEDNNVNLAKSFAVIRAICTTADWITWNAFNSIGLSLAGMATLVVDPALELSDDIEELKALQAKLLHLQQMQKDFAAALDEAWLRAITQFTEPYRLPESINKWCVANAPWFLNEIHAELDASLP